MLNPNISETNAFIRMMCGVAMTGFGVGKIARNPNCTMGQFLIVMGAMRVAEGYYQYCPITAMLKSDPENIRSPYTN